jgi:membrane protease YdiL (CAAX protease family)
VADARTTFDEYVAWYSWATINFAADPIVCHAAAAAAMRALALSGGRDTAAQAATDAARDEASLRRTRADYGSRHRYIEWFVWARANPRFSDERCHEAAQAALQSIAAGGSQRSAAEAATRCLLTSAAADQPQLRLAETVELTLPAARPHAVPSRQAARPGSGKGVSGGRLLLVLVLWPVLAAAALAATVLALRGLAAAWIASHDADLTAIVIAELYVALLVALTLAFGGPAGLRDRLAFRFTTAGQLALALPVWLGALIAGLLATATLSPWLGPPQGNTAPLLRTSFDPLFVGIIVPTLCLLAPACEEMLFRGALYGWLRRHLPLAFAIPITAAVFAGAHLLPTLFPILFMLGIAATGMREWTGSTLNSFAVHATQNTFAVAVTYFVLAH